MKKTEYRIVERSFIIGHFDKGAIDPYKNIPNMTGDEIAEWLHDEPEAVDCENEHTLAFGTEDLEKAEAAFKELSGRAQTIETQDNVFARLEGTIIVLFAVIYDEDGEEDSYEELKVAASGWEIR